jgi:hypothetical protein
MYDPATGGLKPFAPDNFAYLTVPAARTLVVPASQQMVVDGHISVQGHMIVRGDVVDISARHSDGSLYTSITEDEVVEIRPDRLMLYDRHITVQGHLRVNGRISDARDVTVPVFDYGKATLGSGGVAVVLSPMVRTTSSIQLTAAGQPINGKLNYESVIDYTSFEIHTGNGGDNGKVIDWILVN